MSLTAKQMKRARHKKPRRRWCSNAVIIVVIVLATVAVLEIRFIDRFSKKGESMR